jgi:hypothetical protein
MARKRKNSSHTETKKKFKSSQNENEDLSLVIAIMLDFVSVFDMVTLTHVCQKWRQIIDGDAFGHWKQKWRQKFGNHQTISDESDAFTNPKQLCVHGSKDEELLYNRYMQKADKDYYVKKRLKGTLEIKNELCVFLHNNRDNKVALLSSELNGGKLCFFRYYLSGEVSDCACSYGRVELFPLNRDPMNPIKIEWSYESGGMAELHDAYIASNLVDLIFDVDKSSRFYDEDAAEEVILQVFGEEICVKKVKWLADILGIDDKFFLEGDQEDETERDINWNDDNMLGLLGKDYEKAIYDELRDNESDEEDEVNNEEAEDDNA